ncbi:hypothetical protein EOM39_02680 [Candidatus Gracilibacteria bacterium]|nr:hypothetical protein [Candidatus Gracilibacteria bacterium]
MNNSIVNELNKYVNEKKLNDKIILVNYGGFIDLSVYPNGINKGGRIKI